ncbi:14676_t:CDS:2, partial [Ambispora leptoticha]
KEINFTVEEGKNGTNLLVDYVMEQPRLLNLECSKQEITAFLEDGRKLSVPTTWFTRLRKATLKQLKNYRILPDAYHIH